MWTASKTAHSRTYGAGVGPSNAQGADRASCIDMGVISLSEGISNLNRNSAVSMTEDLGHVAEKKQIAMIIKWLENIKFSDCSDWALPSGYFLQIIIGDEKRFVPNNDTLFVH
jgi:hypothetical protein